METLQGASSRVRAKKLFEVPVCCADCVYWKSAEIRVPWGYSSEARVCCVVNDFKFDFNAPTNECIEYSRLKQKV